MVIDHTLNGSCLSVGDVWQAGLRALRGAPYREARSENLPVLLGSKDVWFEHGECYGRF